jgi:tetraacyldisaccharide 4'-kinase
VARRASIVIVTRKAASLDRADFVAEVVRQMVGVPCAVVHLHASDLREASGSQTATIDALRGQSVLAISAIGDPAAFDAQLVAHGALVTPVRFRDHHRFTVNDAESLATTATRYDRAVCTLKDAVKLGPLWPGPSPLWYVSQRVVVERGDDAVDAVLETMLLARSASTQPGRPGLPGPRD